MCSRRKVGQWLVVAARGGFYFFGSRMKVTALGHVTRRPFVQQQFGSLHHGLGVESRTHPAVRNKTLAPRLRWSFPDGVP